MNQNGAPLYTADEIEALLRKEEGQFLEFKSLWDQRHTPWRQVPRRQVRDTVAEYVAAFANADGGTLLLGVEDDGTPTGHSYPEEAVETFLSVPLERVRDPVHCRTQRIVIDGNEVIVLEVPNAPMAVMVEGGGFPYRVNDQVIFEPQEVINQRKESYRRVGYEQRIRPEASLADLDLELAQRFIRNSVFRERSVEEALSRYGLIHPRGGSWAVTNAALLLFGKPPFARWHPRAGIRMFRVAGTQRKPGAERNVTQLHRVEQPLASAITEAHRLAGEQVRRSERLHNLFFREIPEYPEFAWQEAIVNAVAHRDYEIQGLEVEIWFYEDRMEVSSPGDLVPPVTLEALQQRRSVHASRNPLLVRVLADAGVMREEGEGIPRIFEEMERSFLHEPTFVQEDGLFEIVLRNEPVFEGPSPEWQRFLDRLPLSARQKRVLLAHPEGFTNGDYRRINRVDRDQAYREIQEMVDKGVLLPAEAPGRGAVYHITPDLHDTRAFLETRLPRLRSYFERYSTLKNADYRKLFGVSRFAAVRELRRLVDEGYLRMEGERRGAHYVPRGSVGQD